MSQKSKEKATECQARYRNICGTIYNYKQGEECENWEERFLKLGMKYIITGEEICPTTNRPHLQYYCELSKQMRHNTIKTHLINIHFEARKGTQKQAIDYCKKDGSFKEVGDRNKQGERTDLKELKCEIMTGKVTVEDIIIEEPMAYHMYGRTLDKIEDIYLLSKFRTEMTEGIWYWGETGCGKSHKAHENFNPKTHYSWKLNEKNGWQDGYRGQDTVIINDFRGEIKYNEMLQIVDKWVYSVPRRGRAPMPFTSSKVIVTSSLPPEKIFKNRDSEDSIQQLLRRFKVIELKKNSTQL